MQDDSAIMSDRRDTDVVLRVMHRHGIGVAEAAALADLSHPYVSRVVSGQYPPPVALVRALFQRTHDPDLRGILFGESDALVIAVRPVRDAAQATQHFGAIMQGIADLGLAAHAVATAPEDDEARGRLQRVGEATAALAAGLARRPRSAPTHRAADAYKPAQQPGSGWGMTA